MDGAGALALAVGELGPRGVERAHAGGQGVVDRAELDRRTTARGDERDRAARIEPDLGDRGPVGGVPAVERGERAADLRGAGGRVGEVAGAIEAGDDRQAGAVALVELGALERMAFGV